MPTTTANSKHGRAGVFVRQPSGYRAFIPKPLPPHPPLVVDEAMQSALALAERNLGRLDSVSILVPDPDRFVYMYVRQEAVLSTQIEGTQASLSDLLEFEAAEGEGERTVDISEVINYLNALYTGLNLLGELPISTRLLCRVHAALTEGVRGGEVTMTPGELRRSQNWIAGSGPANARYVPPPAPDMQLAMGELEKFLHRRKKTPLLIEIGLAHAQFETIHPFLDGNGRIGRLLITLLLAARGVLSKPLLYLSHFFKVQREDYYGWEGWIEFFLRGVATVADEATNRARSIISLQTEDQVLIRSRLRRRAGTALDLLDLLIERPVVSSRFVCKRLGKTQPTIDKLLSDFVKMGLLHETTGQRWGRRFSYSRYLALFEA